MESFLQWLNKFSLILSPVKFIKLVFVVKTTKSTVFSSQVWQLKGQDQAASSVQPVLRAPWTPAHLGVRPRSENVCRRESSHGETESQRKTERSALFFYNKKFSLSLGFTLMEKM